MKTTLVAMLLALLVLSGTPASAGSEEQETGTTASVLTRGLVQLQMFALTFNFSSLTSPLIDPVLPSPDMTGGCDPQTGNGGENGKGGGTSYGPDDNPGGGKSSASTGT
jgi:hypothetical protein